MEYGWRTVKDSLHPVYFEGNMSAEFLRDLVCSCNTDFLPIPKKEEVVSHPERARAAGRTLPVIYEREEHSS
jgi:hypothetical protein